jgi:hypothetical protein
MVRRFICHAVLLSSAPTNNHNKAARVWLIEYSKNLEKKLESVLPGATWLEWQKKYKEPKAQKGSAKMRALVNQIAGYLAIMGDKDNYEPISPRMIKEAVGYTGTKNTFLRAVNIFLLEHPEWIRDGYSFIFVKKVP